MSRGWDSLSGGWNTIKQFMCHAITDHANADCVSWTTSEPTARRPREFHYQCKCGYRFWNHTPPKGWKDIESCEFCRHYESLFESIDGSVLYCHYHKDVREDYEFCAHYETILGAVVDNDHLLKRSR